MADLHDYEGRVPAWCPGCGNFGILRAFNQAVSELGLAPHQFTIVSGIGQAGKFPHYTRCNTFNGLHGRTLPVATGIRLVNRTMPVIAVAGDGDGYGEGGNHLIHAIRKNIDVAMFVHDNQVYALTKGQASPTTMKGMKTKAQPGGTVDEAELITHTKTKLAGYKAPRRVRFVESIGRAPTGKVDYAKHSAETAEWARTVPAS